MMVSVHRDVDATLRQFAGDLAQVWPLAPDMNARLDDVIPRPIPDEDLKTVESIYHDDREEESRHSVFGSHTLDDGDVLFRICPVRATPSKSHGVR